MQCNECSKCYKYINMNKNIIMPNKRYNNTLNKCDREP